MQRLTYFERQKIEMYLRLGKSYREIAKLLRRDHTVVSREVKNNKGDYSPYTAEIAQRAADLRARRTNKRKLDKYPKLKEYVVGMLREDWSPEEIAGRLKEQPPSHLKGKAISYESIYDYIYNGEGKFEYLYPHLRRGKPKGQKQKNRRKQAQNAILDRISIHERPEIVNEKKEFGHWESDTLCFGRQREAVSVQHERKTLLVRLNKLANKSAPETQEALTNSTESLPPDLWQSITFDNGLEGACHINLKKILNLQTYFCDAYASWQKGGVENSNGLIRQYLPKNTDASKLTNRESKKN
jgi:IS30 family transposase